MGPSDNGKKAPDGEGMWIQGHDGLWYNVGTPSGVPHSKDFFALVAPSSFALIGPASTGVPADVLMSLGEIQVAKMMKHMDACLSVALPPFPPNPLEEPPPAPMPDWRALAAAFEMTNGRRPIVAPTGLELELSLFAHFGSTDPSLKAKT